MPVPTATNQPWLYPAQADPAQIYSMSDGFGGTWLRGYNTELLTLSTSGLTTDTVANLLPANSIIEAVVTEVVTTITVTASWAVGDATTAARFSPANSTLVAGTSQVGLAHRQGNVTTTAAGATQAAAAKVRITGATSNPGAGVVRVTVFYSTFTPQSS